MSEPRVAMEKQARPEVERSLREGFPPNVLVVNSVVEEARPVAVLKKMVAAPLWEEARPVRQKMVAAPMEEEARPVQQKMVAVVEFARLVEQKSVALAAGSLTEVRPLAVRQKLVALVSLAADSLPDEARPMAVQQAMVVARSVLLLGRVWQWPAGRERAPRDRRDFSWHDEKWGYSLHLEPEAEAGGFPNWERRARQACLGPAQSLS